MKITEALCNVITEAGGTPTTADADSVTHALGTLYTTLGGTDTLPDDVADRINSLSDHIGGGGLEFAEVTIRIDGIDSSATAQGIDGVALRGDAFIRTDGGQILLSEGAFTEGNEIYKRPNSESSGTALYPKNIINGMDIFMHTVIKFVYSGSSQLGDLAESCYIEMTSQNCLDEETMAVISDGYVGYTLYFGD